MGHELYAEDQMFSVRERPWHADETNSFVLADYPGREKAMKLAGHDFEVVELPVYEMIGDQPLQLDGFKLMRNSKTGFTFAVAKDSWTGFSNAEGWDLAEAILDDDDIQWETGGTLKHGSLCWVLAKLRQPFQVPGDDSLTWLYLSTSWGHDGMSAVKTRSTNVREVCWNTVSMSEAVAEKEGHQYTFRHTKNIKERIEAAKEVVRGAKGHAQRYQELATELAGIPLSDQGIERFMSEFSMTAQPAAEVSDRVQAHIEEARGEFWGILNGGLTVPGNLRNTAYGVVQASIEMLDHIRGYKSRGSYVNRTVLRDENLKAQLVPLARRVAEEVAA